MLTFISCTLSRKYSYIFVGNFQWRSENFAGLFRSIIWKSFFKSFTKCLNSPLDGSDSLAPWNGKTKKMVVQFQGKANKQNRNGSTCFENEIVTSFVVSTQQMSGSLGLAAVMESWWWWRWLAWGLALTCPQMPSAQSAWFRAKKGVAIIFPPHKVPKKQNKKSSQFF